MKRFIPLLLTLAFVACKKEDEAMMDDATARISGSKLIIAGSGSIFNPGSLSSWTEIDFCSGGAFVDYSESFASVDGGTRDYNTGQWSDNVSSASVQNASGSWRVTSSELLLNYNSGSTVSYNLPDVLNGSWENRNFRFAMDWGNGQCP